MEYHYTINFVDISDQESFRWPQCACGKLAPRHYEFQDSRENVEEAYVVDIVCEECLVNWLKSIG